MSSFFRVESALYDDFFAILSPMHIISSSTQLSLNHRVAQYIFLFSPHTMLLFVALFFTHPDRHLLRQYKFACCLLFLFFGLLPLLLLWSIWTVCTAILDTNATPIFCCKWFVIISNKPH